jgi:hypothetical protein
VKVLVVFGIVAIVSAGIGLASGAILATTFRQPRRHLWIDALLGIPGFLISYFTLYQIAPLMSVYGPASAGVVGAFAPPAIRHGALQLKHLK